MTALYRTWSVQSRLEAPFYSEAMSRNSPKVRVLPGALKRTRWNDGLRPRHSILLQSSSRASAGHGRLSTTHRPKGLFGDAEGGSNGVNEGHNVVQ